MNIQNTEKQWPATAGLVDDTLTPYEILERSSQFGRNEHYQILNSDVWLRIDSHEILKISYRFLNDNR
jgi:hypothetical protein